MYREFSQPIEAWDLQFRFSSWEKLLRVTAYVIRYIDRLKNKHRLNDYALKPADGSNAVIMQHEIRAAKIFWLKRIQAESFPQDLASLTKTDTVSRSSPLQALSPYLDDDGLICVRGRLRRADLYEKAKHPVILKAHALVTFLISDVHLRGLHAQLILVFTRAKYDTRNIASMPGMHSRAGSGTSVINGRSARVSCQVGFSTVHAYGC